MLLWSFISITIDSAVSYAAQSSIIKYNLAISYI